MTPEEMRKAFQEDEPLEYHVMGGEIDPYHLLPVHGWYPCFVNRVKTNGNVDIILKRPDGREIGIMVLKRNIPIAFRREQGATQ